MADEEIRENTDEGDGLASFLRQQRNRIIAHWEQAVRRLPRAAELPRPQLVDFIPGLLDEIANLIDGYTAGRTPELPWDVAERHALDRLVEGFDLATVINELSTLRDCILVLWHPTVDDAHEQRVLHRAMDRAIVASSARYTHNRNRILIALERVSSYALESKNMADFLRSLLTSLREDLPAADTVALYLREGDTLVLRAESGMKETSSSCTRRIGEGFVGRVAETGQPLHLTSAAEHPLVRSEMLQAQPTKALYGVPLMAAGEVMGVARMGSFTAERFSVSCRVLFEAMTSRAAIGIQQHRLREQLEQTLAKAKEAVTVRDHILAVVSHDLRNPLSVIGIACSLMLKSTVVQENPSLQKQTEAIQRSAGLASRLIDDLLDLSSIRGGRLALHVSENEIGPIIDEAVDAQRPAAHAKGVELRRASVGLGARVVVDRVRLLQVLSNLIGNAIKFCAFGDQILVRSDVSASHVTIAVADTGPGIPSADLEHLFDPYWRGHSAHPGLGLGLTIAKDLIEAHQGRIWVESRLGHGSIFHVALPLAGARPS